MPGFPPHQGASQSSYNGSDGHCQCKCPSIPLCSPGWRQAVTHSLLPKPPPVFAQPVSVLGTIPLNRVFKPRSPLWSKSVTGSPPSVPRRPRESWQTSRVDNQFGEVPSVHTIQGLCEGTEALSAKKRKLEVGVGSKPGSPRRERFSWMRRGLHLFCWPHTEGCQSRGALEGWGGITERKI